jgi:mono/diheme cytochrome c family protein
MALLAAGAIAFVGVGIYDIGADDHHTKVVLAIIEQLRERSIITRARGIVVPNLADPEKIAAGARRYAALGTQCHLAPGVSKSTLRTGLYPHPPNLAQEGVPDAQHTFWVIKHGIKMSAMPAWGKTQDDAEIWGLVAFIRQRPEMTPESYKRLYPASRGERNSQSNSFLTWRGRWWPVRLSGSVSQPRLLWHHAHRL